jgi:hypothetical protein
MVSRGSPVVASRERPGETPHFVADRDAARDDLLVLPLEVSGTVRQVAVVDAYCTAPKCPCRHARLWLVDVTAAAAPHPQRTERILAALERTWVDGSPWLELELDLAGRKVSLEADAVAASEQRKLLDRAKEALLPFQIDAFREHRDRVRAWAKANPVNSKRWSKVNDLGSVDWCAIFPDAPALLGVHEGRQYLLHDAYCANPGCTCEEALISPCERPSGDGPWVSLGCLRVSLSPEEGPVKITEATAPGLESILRSFLELRPGALQLLRKRKALLRELARLREKEQEGAFEPVRLFPPSSEPPLPAAAERPLLRPQSVARNAPCCCGSGRKFKNCCGRVGAEK